MNQKVYQIAFQLGAKMNSSVRSAFATAQKQIGAMEKKAEVANSSFQRMNNTISGVTRGLLGLGAAYASFDAAKGLIGGAVQSASSLEGYRNTLNVVMKDQEKAAKMMQWSVDFANKTPFETDSVVEATVRLQSYGLQAQKVLPSIGNMAGVMNKDIMQAVEAVADAQTGELERLKEFGITKAMIAKKAGEMYKNQEIINNKGQIVQQEKFNSALFSLMNDRFKGGMDIQANSFKGIMSTVTGVWKTGLATMAGISSTGEITKGSFFDVVKSKAKGLGDTLTAMAENGTFTKIGQTIGSSLSTTIKVFSKVKSFGESTFRNIQQAVTNNLPAFQSFGSSVSDALRNGFEAAKPVISWLSTVGLPNLVDFLGGVARSASNVYRFFKNNWSTIKPIIIGLAIAIGSVKAAMTAMSIVKTVTGFIKAFKIASAAARISMLGLNGAMLANPMTWVVAGIIALIAAGVFLYKNWDTVKEKAFELWGKVKEVFGKIGGFISEMWSNVAGAAKSGINGILKGINSMIRGVNGIKIKVPKWVGKIPGVPDGISSIGFNIPEIPMLAKGGITTGPTLAMIGEGPEQEVVLPLSKLKSFLNTGSGGDNYSSTNKNNQKNQFILNLTIQGNASEKEIKQAASIGKREFKRMLKEVLHEQNRLSFNS